MWCCRTAREGQVRLRIVIAAMLLLALAGPATAQERAAACPGLLPGGQRVPLSSPPIDNESLNRPPVVPVPPALAEAARNIVGLFEGGGADPYTNIGGIDGISLGYLQWNHGTGSLYTSLLSRMSAADVQLAPAGIRSDLKVLLDHAHRRSSRSAANEVVRGWTTATASDPLIRRVRRSVRQDLSAWLDQPPIRAHQKALVETRMQSSYRLARAWNRDTGRPAEVSPRLLAYFFDLEVFNGSRQGIWVRHVRDLRARVGDSRNVLAYIDDWMSLCEQYRDPNASDKKLYNVESARRNTKYWKTLHQAEPHRFDDEAVDLLVFGYLRATRSNGSNPPRGFPGIFQADVMNRRGMIAVGKGYLIGSSSPREFYRLVN